MLPQNTSETVYTQTYSWIFPHFRLWWALLLKPSEAPEHWRLIQTLWEIIKFSPHWLNNALLPAALISTWLNNHQGLTLQWNLTFKLSKNQYRKSKKILTTQNSNLNGKCLGEPHLIFKLGTYYYTKHLKGKIGNYTMNQGLSYAKPSWKSQHLIHQSCHCSKYFWSFSFTGILK